ncbi:TPA: hypothetical protein ACSPJ7_001498 [Bacillus cereus]
MIGFTKEKAIEHIKKSNETGWEMERIDGTNRYTLERKLTTEELHDLRYTRPKKFAQLTLDIINSDIKKNYHVGHGGFGFEFEYFNDFEVLFEFQIGLQHDSKTYVIFDRHKIVFKSECTKDITNYIKQRIEAMDV